MKRNFIIRNVIIAIIVIGMITGIVCYFLQKVNRDYEIEEVESYNYFVLKQEAKSGVIDRSGNIIIEAKYDEVKIPNPSKALFACYENGNVKILNEKGEEILTDYDKVEPIRLKNVASNLMYEKSVLKYEENGKYGIIKYSGKKITKAIYEEIEGLSYKEGELTVKSGDKMGIINIKGKELVSPEYDKITVDGYYTAESGYRYAGYIVSNKTENGYRYGYINYMGKELLKLEYNEVYRIIGFEDKETAYLIVAKDGQYGLIQNEKEIISKEYQSIEYDETNEVLIIEKSKKYGVATLDGNVIVPTKYDQIDITGIYIYAENSQGITVYNNSGSEVNIDKNIAILTTENEKYKIRINNQNGTLYGVIGQDGNQIIEEKYKYLEYLHDDYFIASNGKSKLGVIDNKENEKIEIENDSIQRIDGSNMIQATIDKITKIYSPSMEKLCELENAIVEVKSNYIKVYNNEEIKYFSKEGKELTSKEIFNKNTLFAKREGDKWGFEDKNGQIVISAKYEKVTEFNEYGFASVKIDGKWGAINQKGEVVVIPAYEFEEGAEPSFINKYYQVTYGYGEEYYTNSNT